LLVRQLVSKNGAARSSSVRGRALARDEVRAFEALTRSSRGGPPRLPAPLAKRARSLLTAAVAPALAAPASAVADRWIAGLAPLETVVLSRAPAKPPGSPHPRRARPGKRR